MSFDPEQLRVAELMTLDPVTVLPDASLQEAEELLRSYQVSGLPVVDEGGDLVGVISKTDLLHLSGRVRDRFADLVDGELHVADLMTSPAVVIGRSASVHEAARIMDDHHLHRLVVVDESDRPVGVLSAMDFVALAAERP
jgi:CBS-domain-containing membrane protein